VASIPDITQIEQRILRTTLRERHDRHLELRSRMPRSVSTPPTASRHFARSWFGWPTTDVVS
jgi:hypothetical protein